jgi:hypothetical protein
MGIKIERELHKKIAHEAIDTHMRIHDLIDLAWQAYEREKQHEQSKAKPKETAAA